MQREGMVRLEVRVRQEDAPLVRGVVQALGDPHRETEARATLRRFGPKPKRDLKALLLAAPLEGVDLTRNRRVGRDVDL
jgi:hypothetical protein